MNKVVFVLAAVLALAFSEKSHVKLYKLHEECQESPVTKLDKVFIDSGKPSDSPNFGSHVLCIYAKGGIMNQHGDVNVENLRTVLSSVLHNDAAKVDEIVEKCGVRVGTSPNEAAIALNNCLSKYDNLNQTLEW
ncbi:hypothetical protein JTB14_032800 [Gonioctena quinquepunctata]|nr:hypothetical protein JTB14_032800 [Gonioctena quinquepunctata]